MAMNLSGKLRKLLGLDLIARGVAENTSYILKVAEAEQRRGPPPPPPAFVIALAEGTYTPDVAPVLKRGKGRIAPAPRRLTLGRSASLTESGNLELMSQEPLTDVRVIVFADLRRVDVALFYGAELCAAAYGECPIAYLPRWEVGVKLTVSCKLWATSRYN